MGACLSEPDPAGGLRRLPLIRKAPSLFHSTSSTRPMMSKLHPSCVVVVYGRRRQLLSDARSLFVWAWFGCFFFFC
jgi:hypothetical protein